MKTLFRSLPLLLAIFAAHAADEIQIYTDDLRQPGEAGLEIHINRAIKGDRVAAWPGQIPSHHALNLTPEFSWYLAENMDWGIYLPATQAADGRWQGNGIKFRVKHLTTRGGEDDKTFYGLNFELARNRITVSENGWASELRSILGRETGRWMMAVNATLASDWSGPGRTGTPDFTLSGTVLRKVGESWAFGVEHHAELGKLNDLQPWKQTPQTTYLVGNYETKGWALHLGLGHNWTDFGDKSVLKAIVSFEF